MFPVCVLICVPVRPSIHQLRQTVSTEHTSLKQQEMDTMPRASYGYGGKFGLQEDRMDKVRLLKNKKPTAFEYYSSNTTSAFYCSA